MATLFADDFNDSDGTLIDGRTLPVGGGTWSPMFGSTAEIQSNQYVEQSDAGAGYVNVMDAGQSDVDVSITIASFGLGFVDAGIVFRVQDSSNAWILLMEQAGPWTFTIYELNGGVLTARDQNALSIPGAPFTIKVSLSGTSITGYENGTPTVSYTSSFLQSETVFGLRNYVDTGITFNPIPMDDYLVEGVAPAGGGQPLMRRWGGSFASGLGGQGIGQSSGKGKAWG